MDKRKLANGNTEKLITTLSSRLSRRIAKMSKKLSRSFRVLGETKSSHKLAEKCLLLEAANQRGLSLTNEIEHER